MDSSPRSHLDLGLTPDDPLSLLLHSSPPSEDASSPESNVSEEQTSNSDWASLWSSSAKPEENHIDTQFMQLQQLKNIENDMELSPFATLGTMDFNPSSMVVDPNALHHSFSVSPEAFAAPQGSFPFTFQPPQNSIPRRLSLGSTSDSSPSAAPYSPVVESSTLALINDSAAQLAQRVRQSAGVMFASPTGASLQSNGLTISFPDHEASAPLLAHPPRDQNQSCSSISSSSSTASTPPPTTPPLVHAAAAPTLSESANTKPKTSHTTIERRYRTNLNSRIHALRMAVPALRVLEEKEASVGGPGKKGGKGKLSGRVGVIKSVSPSQSGGPVDIVDERGFIDGVKVARKVSKANVLGKAVEYIRVLKKREARLKREQEGLKELISGLVGGHALLKKWEEEWKAMFGGEEKDELEEGEGIEACADDASDDDGDSDDEGRKRKKPKVDNSAKSQAAQDTKAPSDGPPPEKRKRGRPRKNPLPPPPPSTAPAPPVNTPQSLNVNMLMNMAVDSKPEIMSSFVHQPPSHTQSQMPQYMMATFALFSFFNSPITTSVFTNGSDAPHQGHVLTPTEDTRFDWKSFSWHSLIQVFHLFVSILVFASIVFPWLPPRFSKLSAHVPKSISRLLSFRSFKDHSSSTSAAQGDDDAASVVSDASTATPTSSQSNITLSAALLDQVRGTDAESTKLSHALRSSEDGLLRHVGRMGALFTGKYSQEPRIPGAYEQKSLTQRAWIRLGELIVLHHQQNVSTYSRLYTYYQIRTHVHWFGASAGDLVTMALLLWPISIARGPAQALWETARSRSQRAHEKLVLDTLTPEEAWTKLETACQREARGCRKYTPVSVLGQLLVESRTKKHLKVLFVDAVTGGTDERPLSWDLDLDMVKEQEDANQTVDAAMSLGGRYHRALGESLRLLSNGKNLVLHIDNPQQLLTSLPLSSLSEDMDSEIPVLLKALVLCRNIFPSSIAGSGDSLPSILVSPVPNKDLEMKLRILLGEDVFDAPVSDEQKGDEGALAAALDDARETVVGLLEERQENERRTVAPILLS